MPFIIHIKPLFPPGGLDAHTALLWLHERCFEIAHPLSCCAWNDTEKHTAPIQSLNASENYLKPPEQQPKQSLVNLVWWQHASSILLAGQWIQSEWLSFRMSHHYVVDCGEKGMEKWEAERQSCSLMACKVISCGLVKLKAASLGCNSWQSCPPFTPANPSFRAFSHNQRFMERGRETGLHEARKKTMTTKSKLQRGAGWKGISTASRTPSGPELWMMPSERYELQNGSLLCHSALL